MDGKEGQDNPGPTGFDDIVQKMSTGQGKRLQAGCDWQVAFALITKTL